MAWSTYNNVTYIAKNFLETKILPPGIYKLDSDFDFEFIKQNPTTKDLIYLLAQHPDVPVVTVMEDLDSLLKINNYSKMLNLLDGAYSDIKNIVYLATTNYP